MVEIKSKVNLIGNLVLSPPINKAFGPSQRLHTQDQHIKVYRQGEGKPKPFTQPLLRRISTTVPDSSIGKLSASGCLEVVGVLDDIFVPLPDLLLANSLESRSAVDSFLDNLPSVSGHCQHRICLGPAPKASIHGYIMPCVQFLNHCETVRLIFSLYYLFGFSKISLMPLGQQFCCEILYINLSCIHLYQQREVAELSLLYHHLGLAS